jgi:RNA polymerase-binding transcription factor DksA
MASQRKNPSSAKSAKRTTPVAKKAAKKPAPKPAVKKAAPKPAVKKAAPKPAAKKPAPKPVAKKPVPKPAAKKPAPKPAVIAAKAAKPRKLKAVARPPAPGVNVRPLGVLPPSARARGPERPAAPVPARPAGPGPAPAAKRPARARGPQRLTADELLELEEKLREERAKLMKEMGHLESTVLKVNPRDSAGDLSGYSFHMADAGTDAYERELGFQFASAEGRLLREFNEALRRLYAGEYGVCESCGSVITRARLLAIPTARLCRDCKEKEEREKPSQQ